MDDYIGMLIELESATKRLSKLLLAKRFSEAATLSGKISTLSARIAMWCMKK